MSSQVAITPRNLGSICLDSYCPRCLYYLLRMKFHPPFNHFGAAVFKQLEKIEKAAVGYHLAEDGRLPKEFEPFCDCSSRIEYPRHWSKFKYTHKSGVVLYGEPDEIFRLADGTLCVVDHKTARNKGDGDRFHPQYRVQVIGYANIAEVGLDLGTVTRGGLFYWEMQDQDVQNNPRAHYQDAKVWVPLIPNPLEIEIDYSVLDPLLKQVKKIWNATTPPKGRDGCDDCKKLDLLFAIEQDVEAQDSHILAKYGSFRDVQEGVLHRYYDRQMRRSTAMSELSQSGELMFDSNGLVSNWEFLEPVTSQQL